MSFLRLPPDAPDAVRKLRKRLLVVMALGLVAMVIAVARFVADLNDPFAGIELQTTKLQASATTQAPVAPSVAPAPKPDALPPAPEPAQSAQLAHETLSAPAPPREEVRVQLGAFREQARAQKLAKRATEVGFAASVERGTTSDGKAIFRVRLEQALEKERARELVIELKAKIPKLQPILVRQATRG